MRAAYTGNEALTFNDYMDLETGRTLRAEPGGSYDIAPASGRTVDEVPAPWFVIVSGDEEPADVEPEAEPGPEPEAEPEPEQEPAEGQSF